MGLGGVVKPCGGMSLTYAPTRLATCNFGGDDKVAAPVGWPHRHSGGVRLTQVACQARPVWRSRYAC